MQTHCTDFSVQKMASMLKVSRSGYYRCVNAKPSDRSVANQELVEVIKQIHQGSRGTYGSPRIHAELKARGFECSENRVARLMKENQIHAKMNKRFKKTTKRNPAHPVASNLLEQDFHASKPNEKWVSDITQVWTDEGWLYIAVVMDLFSRLIIGLSMSARMTRDLVIHAFKQAIIQRGEPEEFIYHSDRGSQYTSDDFQRELKKYRIQVSMSGSGNCYDNAAMESFFHTLKTECTNFEKYQTRVEAENSVFEYIMSFYNTQRRHSTINYSSPLVFERLTSHPN